LRIDEAVSEGEAGFDEEFSLVSIKSDPAPVFHVSSILSYSFIR